jgi:hypothetical protein
MFMAESYPKIVESPHYHLWTDALHARALAHQAHNKWDRGTYVRWSVTTAWTVLEIACQEALEEPSISYSFRKNLDEAIKKKSLPALDWGQGIWQQVQEVQDKRKDYMHRFLEEQDLFPDAEPANRAITIIREAVIAIYTHAKRVPPAWVRDDEDRGWDDGSRRSISLAVVHKGVRADDPKAVKVSYVYDGREHVRDILPSGTDPKPYCDDLIQHLNVPASAIRVYEGDKLVLEKSLSMRGT